MSRYSVMSFAAIFLVLSCYSQCEVIPKSELDTIRKQQKDGGIYPSIGKDGDGGLVTDNRSNHKIQEKRTTYPVHLKLDSHSIKGRKYPYISTETVDEMRDMKPTQQRVKRMASIRRKARAKNSKAPKVRGRQKTGNSRGRPRDQDENKKVSDDSNEDSSDCSGSSSSEEEGSRTRLRNSPGGQNTWRYMPKRNRGSWERAGGGRFLHRAGGGESRRWRRRMKRRPSKRCRKNRTESLPTTEGVMVTSSTPVATTSQVTTTKLTTSTMATAPPQTLATTQVIGTTWATVITTTDTTKLPTTDLTTKKSGSSEKVSTTSEDLTTTESPKTLGVVQPK